MEILTASMLARPWSTALVLGLAVLFGLGFVAAVAAEVRDLEVDIRNYLKQ